MGNPWETQNKHAIDRLRCLQLSREVLIPHAGMSAVVRGVITELVPKAGPLRALRCDVPVDVLDPMFLSRFMRVLDEPTEQPGKQEQHSLTHVSVTIDVANLVGPQLATLPKPGGLVDLEYVVTNTEGSRWYASKGTIVRSTPIVETSSGSKASACKPSCSHTCECNAITHSLCNMQTDPRFKKAHNQLRRQRQRQLERERVHKRVHRAQSRQDVHPFRRSRRNQQQRQSLPERMALKMPEAGEFPSKYGLVCQLAVYTMELEKLQRKEPSRITEAAYKRQAFDHARKAMEEADPSQLRERSVEILAWAQKNSAYEKLGLDLDRLRLEMKDMLPGFAPFIDQMNKSKFTVVYLAYLAWEEHGRNGRSFTNWLEHHRRAHQDEQTFLKARAQRDKGELGRAKREAEDQLKAADMLLQKGRAERKEAADLKSEIAELRAQLAAKDVEHHKVVEAHALDLELQQAAADRSQEKYQRAKEQLQQLNKEHGLEDVDFSESDHDLDDSMLT